MVGEVAKGEQFIANQGQEWMGIRRGGHNFRCPLKSPLSVDPLIKGISFIFHF
jgi:hypothetical protein